MMPRRDSLLASKLLSVALSLSMVGGLVPVQAWAEAVDEVSASQAQTAEVAPAEAAAPEAGAPDTDDGLEPAAKAEDETKAQPEAAEETVIPASAGTSEVAPAEDPAASKASPAPAKAAPAPAEAPAATDDAETARQYVEANVVGASYFITNSTRAGDGTFTLADKTPSGSEVTDLILNTSGDSSGTYMYGITCDDPALSYYRLRSGKRWYFAVKDRPADQHVITLTISVYASDTARADITAGTATPITTVPVRVVLAPAPAKYQVTFSPVDATTGQAVAGATVEVREDYAYGTKVSASSDGTYTLDSSKTYYVKATAAGYADATLADFVPSASGTQALRLAPKVADTYTVSVTDAKTGEAIPGAAVKVTYPSGYSTATLQPQADGTYRLEQGVTYTVTASAEGYQAAGSQKVTPLATGTATTGAVSFSLTPITYAAVTFCAVDPAGDAVEGVGTPTVKDGTSWNANAVQPQADGSYRLEVGSTASVTFTADHYRSSAVSYKVTGEETGPVDIVLTPKENVLTVRVLKAKGTVDEGATVKVTHEEEDWWSDETETVADRPDADGTYTLALPYSSWEDPTTYTITATGSDGTTVSTTFTPSADSVHKTVTLKLYDDPDQKVADAVASAIEDLYALRPHFGTDASINDLVASKLGDKLQGATISVATTDTPATIFRDGAIHYVTSAEGGKWSHIYSKNVDLTFLVTVGDCTSTARATATVGWDGDWFHQQMESEADGLDVTALLGDNPSADQVTSDLALPSRTTSSIWDAYSTIAWTADPKGAVDVETGAVTRGSVDQQVTLTATFKPNDALLNTYVDSADAIGSVTRTYTVTVKANSEKVAAEKARLQAMLENGFAYANVTDFGTGEAIAADGADITGDLQLPTTRKYRDSDGNRLDGKCYSVTYTVPAGTSAVSVDAYHASVVRPLSGDVVVPITCTITSKANPEITASKTLDFTIKAVTPAEIDAEVALMKEAEEGYKAALLGGQTEPVTENLSTFQELYVDEGGNLAVARNVGQADKVHGIVTCELDGYDPMAGNDLARTFKPSDTSILENEDLKLAWNVDASDYLGRHHDRPTYNAKVTVTSKLASERYGGYYAQYKDDPTIDPALLAKLARLAPHDVFATINVAGTTGQEDPAADRGNAPANPGASKPSASQASGAVSTTPTGGAKPTLQSVLVSRPGAASSRPGAGTDVEGTPLGLLAGMASDEVTEPAATSSAGADSKGVDVPDVAKAAGASSSHLPIWPIAGMALGLVALALALVGKRDKKDDEEREA